MAHRGMKPLDPPARRPEEPETWDGVDVEVVDVEGNE